MKAAFTKISNKRFRIRTITRDVHSICGQASLPAAIVV